MATSAARVNPLRRTLQIAACVLLGAAAACHKASGPPPPPLIVVVPKGLTHEYWRTIRVGASDEAKTRGLDLAWPSDFRENDLEAQWNVIDQARQLAASQHRRWGVALAPVEKRALVDLVNDLQASGVPVVIFDSELDGNEFLAFFSTNNEQAGRAAAEALAKQMGDRGNVALLRLNPVSDSTKERERGFLEAIAQHPGIQVVSKDHYGGALLEGGYRQGLALLREIRSRNVQLDAVFCPNESTTLGMLRAIQGERLIGKVKIAGFDRTNRLVSALWGGTISVLVVQDPYEIGRHSVNRLADYFEDPARGLTGTRTYVDFRVVVRDDLIKASEFARSIGYKGPVGPSLASLLPPGATNARELLRLLYPKVAIQH